MNKLNKKHIIYAVVYLLFIFTANTNYAQDDCGALSEIYVMEGHASSVDGPIYEAVFTKDGKQLIGCSNVGVKIWNVFSGRLHDSFLAHGTSVSGISSLGINPQNTHILSFDLRVAKIWEISNKKPVIGLCPDNEFLSDGVFSPDGRLVAVSGENIHVYSAITGQKISESDISGGVGDKIKFSNNNREIIYIDSQKEIVWWDIYLKKETKRFTDNILKITCFDYSPDGIYLLVGTFEGGVSLWDIPKKSFIGTIGIGERVDDVCFSNNSDQLIAVSETKIKILDVENGQTIAVISSQVELFNEALFSPDDKFVLTLSSSDSQLMSTKPENVKLWNAQNGKFIRTFESVRDY